MDQDEGAEHVRDEQDREIRASTPTIKAMPPTSSSVAMTGAAISGAGTPAFAKDACVPAMVNWLNFCQP
jgi:hypothetical protein